MNKERLAQDLGALSSMPELCDVTFLVGEDRQPVCGVRAILAARSKVFRKMLYTDTTAAPVAGSASKRGAKKRQQQQQQQQQHHAYHSSDGYIEKHDFRGQPTVVVRDLEPEVFKQLIHYTHTGGVLLQARTLLGLMNAADHYALDELKQACIRFMERCIAVDSVCSLLSSAEKYIQFKSTKILVQKIFEFVDGNAEAILALRGFFQLPQHVVRIVLSRDELAASEISKFDAAYNWCLHNSVSEGSDAEEIRTLFEPFVDVIAYNRIPARLLMQHVKPAGVVSDAHILTALAFQADPTSISPTKQAAGGGGTAGGRRMQRRMTPTMLESDGGVVVSPHRQQKKTKMSSPQPGHFRRVQSSGVALEKIGGKERKLSSSEHALAKPRNARAGSVPLNSVGSAPNLDVQERGGGGGGGSGGVYSRGSEVHPVRAHHVVMKDRMDSQSSSRASLLSVTPPFSPTHSPSSTTASYQGSVLSGASSSDSVPILSAAPHHHDPPQAILTQDGTTVMTTTTETTTTTTTNNGSGGGGGILLQGDGTTNGSNIIVNNSNDNAGNNSNDNAGNSKKMTYNPLALDAIVNLSSNVVEV